MVGVVAPRVGYENVPVAAEDAVDSLRSMSKGAADVVRRRSRGGVVHWDPGRRYMSACTLVEQVRGLSRAAVSLTGTQCSADRNVRMPRGEQEHVHLRI